MAKKSARSHGEQGEDYAVKLLKRNGYKIIKRNFRTKLGEIDIVALSGDTLVFIEVKTRWSRKFGLPEEAVTPQKLRKIKRVGQLYSLSYPTAPKKMRVDVVALEVKKGRVSSAKIIKAI